MTNNCKKVTNWLLVNDTEPSSLSSMSRDPFIQPRLFKNHNQVTSLSLDSRLKAKNQLKLESKISRIYSKVGQKLPESSKKRKLLIEENELTKSPISGTYIIKDWNVTNNYSKSLNISDRKKTNRGIKEGFSKNEVELNSIAASFVEITPQSRAKLQKIPNKIGPYECKLCKIVYRDAFELAMHNCPRVVHIEYK